jgi:hypothetical protein
VSELVEQSLDLFVREERWRTTTRRGEVADQGHGRSMIKTVRQAFSWEEGELSEVVILARSREEIQIDGSHGLAGGRI